MVSPRYLNLALTGALASGGCAGASAARAPLAEAPAVHPPIAAVTPEAPQGPQRAALRFELDGRRFPSPLVDAMIGGQATKMVVDTGATHHVVARWFATGLALPITTAGDAATDHAGQAVSVARVEKVSFSLPGWGALSAPVLLVIPVPVVLERLGIGGFMSPQALSSEGRAVILDLRAGSMTQAPVEEALRSVTGSPGAGMLTRLRACGGGEREGTQLVAEASIEGITAEVKIDSGATHSSLFATRGAGKRLAPRASGATSAYAASGRYTVPTFQGAHFKLGTFEATADIDILPNAPEAPCASDGYMGMDVLRSCVLVLAGERSAIRCTTPAG